MTIALLVFLALTRLDAADAACAGGVAYCFTCCVGALLGGRRG